MPKRTFEDHLVDVIRRGVVRAEIWPDCPDWHVDLAMKSPVFKELMRPGPGGVGCYARLHSLSALWDAAGRPAEFEPRDYAQRSAAGHARRMEEARRSPDPDAVMIVGELEAEHRGESGWFADWETGAWYAHELDPEVLGIEEVCELLY